MENANTPSTRELQEQAEALDFEFAALSADERLTRSLEIFGEGLIATTSFGRDAGLLLHHVHRLKIPLRVFFIDTSFHFPETLAYRDTLTREFHLRLHTVASDDPLRRRYAVEGQDGLRITEPDACCGVNKVAVQRKFLALPDVRAFLSGLRRDQSVFRKNTPFAQVQRDRIKLAPFADWPQGDVEMYLRLWEVLEHPLAAQGYSSIGCHPLTCTQRPAPGEDLRSGRWAGEAKSECGLHLDLGP